MQVRTDATTQPAKGIDLDQIISEASPRTAPQPASNSLNVVAVTLVFLVLVAAVLFGIHWLLRFPYGRALRWLRTASVSAAAIPVYVAVSVAGVLLLFSPKYASDFNIAARVGIGLVAALLVRALLNRRTNPATE